MHLFLDANKLLAFYGLPKAQLAELEKLVELVKDGTVTLYLPDQVVAEVRRNRGKVLSQLRKVLSDARILVPLPESSDQFEEREALKTAQKEAHKRHSDLVQAFDAAAEGRTLAADTLIEQLFAACEHIDTAELVARARERHDRGQPPGKGSHIGDEINWEALLETAPVGADMHIVADDGDYFSQLDKERIHESLHAEWKEKKEASLRAYRDLATLTGEHFPEIALASDVQKVRHIRALASSGSFAETHAVVARLAQYALFSPTQAQMIVEAAATNSQVRWIADDEDVLALLSRVIEAHRAVLDPGHLARLERDMYPERKQPATAAEADDDEEFPF